MIPVGGDQNDGRSLVQRQASDILASLDFAPEPQPIPSASIIRHLRKFLVMTHGYGWLRATITEHTMPDGSRAFTAAHKCQRCGEIETFIVTISDDGEMVFACPLEDE